MGKVKLFSTIFGIGAGTATVLGTLWAFGNEFGFRPALKAEVDAVSSELKIVGSAVGWLELKNFEELLSRGVKLTRRDCARYRSLAKQLGVTPRPC